MVIWSNMPTVQETFDAQRDAIVQYAIDNTLNSAQMFNVTRKQLGTILSLSPDDPSWSGSNDGRFLNLRRIAAQTLRDQEDQAILTGFLTHLGDYLSSRFPNVEFEKRRLRGRRILSIHIDGIPPDSTAVEEV